MSKFSESALAEVVEGHVRRIEAKIDATLPNFIRRGKHDKVK